MTNQRLKEVTAELNKTTSSDIVGVGYGFKTVNGKSTSDRTIVFTVIRKKPLSEIPEEERIPSEITIDGETFSTDVIEGTITPFAYGYCDPSFYNWQGTPPSNRNTHRPLMGGISVTNHTALGNYVGTMGFIAVDNDTNTLVGVSNNHVLSDDSFYTSDRDLTKTWSNVFDHSCIQPNELGNSDPLNEIGKVKRYEPISPVPFNNEVDGALISLQPADKQNPQQGTIDPAVSWIQHGITGMTSAPRFATTSEIDTLFENPAQEYYTAGRTTGAKGQGLTKLFCTANSTSISINYTKQGVGTTCYMNDTFELQASGSTTPTGDWCYYPSAGGDSGSAILTKIEEEFVIVGLLYGGRQIPDPDNPEQSLPIATLCNRIDNVASALNISAWDGNFQNYAANAPQVYIHQGQSTDKFMIVNGVKHYQLGLVSNSTHPFNPTPQPTATTEPTPTPTATIEPTPTPTEAPIPYYVSIDGTDDSGVSGDIDNPFQTLNYAISRITNQDTIYFREGSYEFDEKEITNTGLSIQSYNNENVTFDGTRPIEDLKDINVNGGNWETYTTDVVTDNNQTINNKTLYRIKLRNDVEIWQLFHNRNEVINARFPSAQWSDDSVYSHDNWGHGYYDYKGNGDIEDGSGNIIGNGTGSHYYYENGEIVDVAHNNINLYDFVNAQFGINPGFNLTGSLINLNVGSFRSYTKVVNSQTLDSSNQVIRLSYDNVATWKEKHHYYYLENKLEFLNSENEWFFDNSTKYLYVWLENDEVPSLTSIRAKVQSYSLNVTGDDVTVEDINFFGTTLRGNTANNLTVRDCDFLYASCYPHMLNQINYGTPISPTTDEVFENQTRVTSSSNVTFEGCAFRYTDGDVIHTAGGNTTIEDCYFNYIDKTVANLSSVMTTLRLMGDGNTVKNNMFRKTAASSTLNSGNAPIIEYNDMAESGYLQSDGAMIHLMVGQQPNSKVRFNWVHDTIKYGIRFDGDGDGYNGSIHHNIGWNCEGAIMAKGGWLDSNGNSVGGHFIYNNTVFNSTVKNDIMVLNTQKGVNINNGSVVMNNLTEKLSGHRTDPEAFESWIINSNNFTPTNVEDYLVNAASNDFRPINDSSVVDAGNTTYTNSEFSPTGVDVLTDDIGALQYGVTAWEAGITWGINNIPNRFNFYFEPTPTPTPTGTPTPTSTPEPTGVIDPTPTATIEPTPTPTSTPAPQTLNLNYNHLNSCSTSNLILTINGVQQGSNINLSQGSTSSGTIRGPISVYPGDQVSLQYKPFNLISPCTLSYQNPTVEVFLNGVSVGTNSNDSVYSTYTYTVQAGVNPTLLVEMNSFPVPTATPTPTYTLTLENVTTSTYAEQCAKGYITVEKNGSVVATLTKTQGNTYANWDASSVSFTAADVVTMKSYSQGGGGTGCTSLEDTTVRCVYNGSARTLSQSNAGTNGQSYTIPDENGTAFGWFFGNFIV